MIRPLTKQRYGPIGIDIGARSVKMVQLSADHTRLIDAARSEWNDLEADSLSEDEVADRIGRAISRAREGRDFRGRGAVMCLNHQHLFLQNIRVPKGERKQMDATVQQEAAGRVPFPVAEAEIRYLEAADIRYGDSLVREVILMACHRPVLDRSVELVERAGLRPLAVDVEPAAILRTFVSQHRRERDLQARTMIVDIGYLSTTVVIADGEQILFIKYLDLGGRHLDEAVARALRMQLAEASSLRRHSGDRRGDRQDPEIASSVADATRPVIERLATELSKCLRYHSVTFRGQPLGQVILGGGEATDKLAELFHSRLGIRCDLSDPFRVYPTTANGGRRAQWDVAAGLALRRLH